jgi:ubiquinone/menaquinone biosynthesis C-methylase UbiE
MTHAHSHDHSPGHPGALADLLDLDATVLHASWADITAWVRRLCDGIPHRRILDLGAGTGNGTVALAQQFRGAEVVALDVSAEMLDRVRRRALDLGLAGRVRTVHADLDADWPALDPVDLAWASMSLHEVADPDRVLADVRATLHPGGLLALVEIDGPVRFLADDGLESRLLSFPHHQQDWGLRLERAGLEVVATRAFAVGLTPPHPPSVGRYAHAWFSHLRSSLAGTLSPQDAALLDALIDPHGPGSVLHRDDLVVRGTRTGWVARRP